MTRYQPHDPRLGRHVNHDARSLAYQAPEPVAPLVSAQHHSAIGVLDQGQVGSCTASASVKRLTYPDLWSPDAQVAVGTDPDAAQAYALGWYSDEETIDGDGPYPPNDNGSSGLTAAKVARARGFISGYTHATSLAAALAALTKAPVITGVTWTSDMFTPDSEGRIRPTGTVQGGHEFVLDQIDVEAQRVWMQNSWGDGWGINGRAWLTWDDYQSLLADQGDVTIFVPLTAPAPVPAPAPEPVPVEVQAQFIADATAWAEHVQATHPAGHGLDHTFAREVQAYLSWLGEQ